MDSDTSVKVAVRIRPLLEHELSQQCSICVNVVPDAPQIVVGSDQNFTFDYVYGIHRRQEEVMEECVMPLVDALFEGFNATILAYGQTGSGKTYTMGSASSKRLAGEVLGIIPRAIQAMFDTIADREENDHNCTFRIRVQFLEIYGEEIRDLLDPSSSSKVSIRETAGGSVYVSGAREELVTSMEESMMALEKGSMCRMTASTRMNETSSRSHGIFTVILEQTLHSRPAEPPAAAGPDDDDDDDDGPPLRLGTLSADADGRDSDPPAESPQNVPPVDFTANRTEPEVRKCKFHFVDLAGSERVKRTGAEGLRLREGIDINKGLLVLGNVISALGDEQKRGKVHVPYRDSKLTRMLQDSLGGNSKTLMICCVSPADSNFYESLNALKYANRARNIQNKPRVNIDPTVQLLSELRKHVQCLATEVLRWRIGLGVDAPPSNPSTATLQAVPFQISSELLQNLASSGGGTAKLLLSHSTAPQVANSNSSSSKSPSSNKHARNNSSSVNAVSVAPIALPSANISAAENLAARKAALEQEAVIFALKQKLSDAESEVHRLTEVARRQKQHASDLVETNSLLQSERDFYKLKLRDAGIAPLYEDSQSTNNVFREDFVSEQPDTVDKETDEYRCATEAVAGSSIGTEHKDVHVVVELLSRYIREISALKESNIRNLSNMQHRKMSAIADDNDCSPGALDLNTVTSTMIGMDTHEPMGGNMFDSNVTMLENDLTSSVARVISQTQRELHFEQLRLNILKSTAAGGQQSVYGVDDSGELNFGEMATLDASLLPDEHDGGTEGGPGNEVEAQDRAFRRRQMDMSSEVVGLSNSIELKEQLLLQLQRSQRQYEMMKLFYENKLISLSEEVSQTEAEKQKVSSELEQLSHKADRTLDKEEDLKAKLKQKDNELRVLHRKQKELTHHSQVQSRSLNQISKLESEIEHMKRTRVDLTKQIHAEKKKHLAALNVKAREIEKLKTELNKTAAEMKKVSKEKERAENRTREALKEGADLRRKVHEITKVSPALTSETASSAARFVKKPSSKQVTSTGGGWNSNTTYRSTSKRLLSEEEIKTKRYLDKALQKISERERAAEALRQQYEQQLALMNQKKQLETSRSSLRDLITSVGSPKEKTDNSSARSLTAAEEDALMEVEERIQNLEGQLISRKVRIQDMQTKLEESGKKGSSDSTVEYLQKKSADSLPAAHELLRLLFDMLVLSKVSIKKMHEQLESAKDKEKRLKEQLEDEASRLQSLQFSHDQELTRMHSDYEEKLSGLLNFSDVSELLTRHDSRDDIPDSVDVFDADNLAALEHSDRRYSRLLNAVSAEIKSFEETGKLYESHGRTRSDSGNLSNRDPEGPDGLTKLSHGKVRALLALSHEKNIFLSNALARESHKVSQLQSDLDEAENRLKHSTALLESRDFDISFLNEECRMLRDLVDEYKERVLSLEGGQGLGIVNTIDQLDKQKRNEKGMAVRYGDNPDVEEPDSPHRPGGTKDCSPAAPPGKQEKFRIVHSESVNAESDDDNSEDFGVLTDEIMKSGSAGPLSDGSNNSNVSIFDRLANPSYFTGTQKKLFQKDLESKRALVKKIKREETVKRKKEGGTLRSYSDDEAPLQREKDDDDDKSGDERETKHSKGEDAGRHLLRRSSFSTDDLDVGTIRAGPVSTSVDFPLRSGTSFESTGTASTHSVAASSPGGDVFSRLLNPTKFTGIHKATGLALQQGGSSSKTDCISPISSPRNGPGDGGDSPKATGKKTKKNTVGSGSQRRGSGRHQQFHV